MLIEPGEGIGSSGARVTQEVVSLLMWVLGIKLRSSARASRAAPFPGLVFLIVDILVGVVLSIFLLAFYMSALE